VTFTGEGGELGSWTGSCAAAERADARGRGGESGRDSVSSVEAESSQEAWQIDPAEITFGPRLAVGGFAEVFRAKWQVTARAARAPLANHGACP
jgi:hypothetical protein